jgi:antitoxin VapB
VGNWLWYLFDDQEIAMTLYIQSERAALLVGELAKLRGVSTDEAVELAVAAALEREKPKLTVMQKLEKFWAEHPMPEPTGEVADKAFFDDLSGDY